VSQNMEHLMNDGESVTSDEARVRFTQYISSAVKQVHSIVEKILSATW